MKGVALAAAGAIVVSGSALLLGQDGGNPFISRSDSGEIVHVLPPPAAVRSPHDTAPTLAPVSDKTAVYAASYGSGNLIDHGGLEIANAGFWAIYWNGSVANSSATSTTTGKSYATIQAELDDFISSFPDNTDYDGSTTDDYTIVQQYGTHAPIASSLTRYGAFVDTKATQKSISDSKIHGYLAGLFNAGKVQAFSNVIYGVYLPPGMRVTLSGGASCTAFCGYHSHFSYGGMQIKYATFPYLNCNACKLSNLTVADMLTIVTSHEIREAVTDPVDSGAYAWYDAAGYEADDKCAWHNLYQMTQGGFWVQPEFSNGGTVTASGITRTYPSLSPGVGGCVVPNR
jgi:hypothetical protein